MFSFVFVYLLIFNYYPMTGLQLAFKKWIIRKGIWKSPWAMDEYGNVDLFYNFKVLFSTSLFKEKLVNTLRISLLKFVIGFPMPLILVLLLNELTSIKFMKFVQSISYIPYFISWVVLGGIFISMFGSGTEVQRLLMNVIGHELYLFSDDKLYLGFLVVSDIYKGVGWGTIIYLASLMSIDPQLYEAASIDGVGRFRMMIYITIPGLIPAISINIILSLSNIMYAGFDQIYNTYNSAVYNLGDTLETYLFRVGISSGQYDIATAIGLFNSVVGCILVIIANRLIKAMGSEGIW